MTKLFQITSVLMILLSCDRRNEIEGTWYAAYTIQKGRTERLQETFLFDFEGEKVYIVKIRDLESGRYDKVMVDTSSYSLSDSTLEFYNETLTFHYAGDSLILKPKGQNEKIVLRRLSSSFKNPDLSPSCFHGAYMIFSDTYQASVDFINDSLFINTGPYDLNYPTTKWQIVDYKGFKFLNQHNAFNSVMLIESCGEEGVQLLYHSIKTYKMNMVPVETEIDKEVYLGIWDQVNYSSLNSPPPPPPPYMSEADMPMRVEITEDEITSRIYGRTKTHKWNLTSDGKRIYFIDKVLDIDGSWKVLSINDSTMTLRVAAFSEPEIVKLKKIKTASAH